MVSTISNGYGAFRPMSDEEGFAVAECWAGCWGAGACWAGCWGV